MFTFAVPGTRGGLEAEIAAAAGEVVVPSDATLELDLPHACNGSQAAAVAVAATGRLTLMHGPPGTGKVRP